MLRRLFFILLLPVYTFCQSFPEEPSNYVTDEANILGPDEEYRLNAVLKAFEDSTSIQLFVYTSPSLNGAVMSDLCQQIFHQWKIGNKKTNNGVLIAIFVNDHKFRIHTGYGIEGILPDLRTKRIQDEIMRPRFKENNYFLGLIEGVNKIVYYTKHEFKPGREPDESGTGIVLAIVYGAQLLFFGIMCLLNFKNRYSKRKFKRIMLVIGLVLFCVPFFGAFGLLLMMIISYAKDRPYINTYRGSTSSSSWDSSWSSSSSSSDYSSSSSSDFGGGGGGDSGGGGSDSSW